MERYTYFEGGKWRLRVGDAEYSGPWVDRLAAYEDTGLEPGEILGGKELAEIACAMNLLKRYQTLGPVEELTALVKARDEGRVVMLPFVAMVEQSLQAGKMTPERDQCFNGRYAAVYSGKGKWGCPLIDICGTPYNSEQAETRKEELTRAEAEAALDGSGEA